jgi:hypothetical protein
MVPEKAEKRCELLHRPAVKLVPPERAEGLTEGLVTRVVFLGQSSCSRYNYTSHLAIPHTQPPTTSRKDL